MVRQVFVQGMDIVLINGGIWNNHKTSPFLPNESFFTNYQLDHCSRFGDLDGSRVGLQISGSLLISFQYALRTPPSTTNYLNQCFRGSNSYRGEIISFLERGTDRSNVSTSNDKTFLVD